MALKAILDSLDGLADDIKKEYVPSPDGKGFVLDLDDQALTKRVAEFRNKNIELDKENRKLKQAVEPFEGLDPVAAREALTKLEQIDAAKLVEAGKVDEMLEKRTSKMRSEHETANKKKDDVIAQLTNERNSLHQRLSSHRLDGTITESVGKRAVVKKGALPDVLARARRIFRLSEDDKLVPDAGGEMAYDAKGNPFTPDTWAEELLQTAGHLFEDPKGGGSGGGRPRDGGPAPKRIVTDDPVEFGKHLEEIASGKVEVG